MDKIEPSLSLSLLTQNLNMMELDKFIGIVLLFKKFHTKEWLDGR